jgi:hypothetical protein
MGRRARLYRVGLALAVLGCACAAPHVAQPQPVPVDSPAPVLIAAGDIADCRNPAREATARLLDGLAGTIAALGDEAYPTGSAEDYANCYDPTWGPYKARTRPALGNHEYDTPEAAGYFGYFGDAGGAPGQGYYSYDLGTWHVVVLNSNCWQIGGCQAGSPQVQWLRADLAAHPANCILAYWHHPLFSSGNSALADVRPFWEALYDARADVVLSGHDHFYERFAPQRPDGTADEQGIRQFIVGTGGAGRYPITHDTANSEVRTNATYGVLKLTLHDASYDWEYVSIPDRPFGDSGSANCH